MFVIGIDVGGTSIKLGVVKDGGDIVYRDQRGTPRSIEEMVRVLGELAESAWQRYPGAEIGISTSKLHAYGPMGLVELTSAKFVVLGQGQVRG